MFTAAPSRIGTTDYHAKLFAYQVTQRFTDDTTDKLASSLMDATVDLNPHQIDAALFAFHSPLSKGVILADEVGLGKTIEAGLVISQFWAERKRRILVLTPASLRTQWLIELQEKFHLAAKVVDSGAFTDARRQNRKGNPFAHGDSEHIVIASIPFGARKADALAEVEWDLVVIDEAHNLRNPEGKRAGALREALKKRRKLLLTATPLQNKLDELWGLTSLIDEHFFGDRKDFSARYGGTLDPTTTEELRSRLRPLIQRTLRKDASEFISYTSRFPLTIEFHPTEEEQTLYDLVSEFLRRDQILALPTAQRPLVTMVLHKLLASSPMAIAGSLRRMASRLQRNNVQQDAAILDAGVLSDYETLEETIEEWDDEGKARRAAFATAAAERIAAQEEARYLSNLAYQAESIAHSAKGDALIRGLLEAFEEMERIKAPRKAIVFTESLRTQLYLFEFLARDPRFRDGLVMFNGSNADPTSKRIYDAWKQRHRGTDRVTDVKAADMRSALVEYFREEGQIMLATEAAAEGINLQFCSLVINYDLPWNPQRVEQRIGRCHRYGQKHDVAVLNFINMRNAADQRVYELLDQKFNLFSGVFGATDTVLGTIESGVDIERQIAGIYQDARTESEINARFAGLQATMNDRISKQRAETQRKLIEHFDEDVAERFRVRRDAASESISRIERALMTVARHELGEAATFSNTRHFMLHRNPFPSASIPLGTYVLPQNEQDVRDAAHAFRPRHELADLVLTRAKRRDLPQGALTFSYDALPGRQSAVETLIGQSGWITARHLTIEMKVGMEDHILLAGVTDDGKALDHEQITMLFRFPAEVAPAPVMVADVDACIREAVDQVRSEAIDKLERRQWDWIDAEQSKLDERKEDRRATFMKQVDEIDEEIGKLRSQRRRLPDGQRAEADALQLEIIRLGRRRDDLDDRNLEERKRINREQDILLHAMRKSIQQNATETSLFTVRWELER